MIKNEKDGAIIDMKVKGCSNKEIALTTKTPIKTVGNLVSKGGRLYPALQSLRQTKEATLVEHSLSVWDTLLAAKDPAIQELKRIALESPNDVARLKAIDMIIELTGIKDEDKPPLLDPHSLHESLDKFLEWINGKLLRTFSENAPKIIVQHNPQSFESNSQFIRTPEDLDRLEKIVKELNRLNDELLNGNVPSGEVEVIK